MGQVFSYVEKDGTEQQTRLVMAATRDRWYNIATAQCVFEFLPVEKDQNCHLTFIILRHNISYYFGEHFLSW